MLITFKIGQDRSRQFWGRRRVDGPFKCLIRQTDNSDNSVGEDRIENSATEIIRSGYNVKAARGNFICDRINAKSIDNVASLSVNPRRTRWIYGMSIESRSESKVDLQLLFFCLYLFYRQVKWSAKCTFDSH